MENKRYEILKALPTYGPMYICVSENGEQFFSEGFIVRFYKTDGTDWVANFGLGGSDLNTVKNLDDTTDLLVVASGICYVMNPDFTEPQSFFGFSYRNIVSYSNGFVLCDDTELTIVKSDGSYWHTDRISYDDLKITSVENHIVTGVAFNPMHDSDEWLDFTYNINTKTLKGGSYSVSVFKRKQWWKFW